MGFLKINLENDLKKNSLFGHLTIALAYLLVKLKLISFWLKLYIILLLDLYADIKKIN